MAQTITLNFKIIGQSLERLDDNRIVEKAKNYVNAHFEFNELWDDTTKAILIEGSGLRYKVYLNENNECLIPNRVVRHDGFTLTVVGEDTDKNITITTNDLFISILSNNVTDDTPSYVEEIESETLDVTREGEKYNIEIPESYKNCYIVTSNDITNVQQSGGTFTATLSQTLESVILGFKQNLYIDWENEFPDLAVILGTIKVSNLKPTTKLKLGDDIPFYYLFGAVDSSMDFSIILYQANDTWNLTLLRENLITKENLNLTVEQLELEIADKSKVVANPILVGDEPDLEGAEIDGIKYKVGGGSEVHLYHHCVFVFVGGLSFHINIYNSNPTSFVYNTLLSYIREECQCTDSASYISASGGFATNNITYGVIGVGGGFNQIQCAYINENGTRAYTPMSSSAYFTDTVTQIF